MTYTLRLGAATLMFVAASAADAGAQNRPIGLIGPVSNSVYERVGASTVKLPKVGAHQYTAEELANIIAQQCKVDIKVDRRIAPVKILVADKDGSTSANGLLRSLELTTEAVWDRGAPALLKPRPMQDDGRAFAVNEALSTAIWVESTAISFLQSRFPKEFASLQANDFLAGQRQWRFMKEDERHRMRALVSIGKVHGDSQLLNRLLEDVNRMEGVSIRFGLVTTIKVEGGGVEHGKVVNLIRIREEPAVNQVGKRNDRTPRDERNESE